MTTEALPGFAALTGSQIDERAWEPFAGMSHVSVKYLFSSPGSVAGLLRFAPGVSETRHLHVGAQHHVWVVSGDVYFDGTHYPVGSYLHVPHDMPHDMRAGGDGCTLYFVYVRE